MSSKEFEVNGTDYKIILTDQVIGQVNNLKNLYNTAYEDPESFEDVSAEISSTINQIAETVEPDAEDSDLDGLIQEIIKAVENKATQIENELKEKPLNIKFVHLLLDPNDPQDITESNWKSTIEKQDLSIQCWEKMKHKFTSYVKRYSVVNRTELPVETCMDPEIINTSKEFKNEPPVLTYGHYGAYRAHTQGIYENFDEDVDVL